MKPQTNYDRHRWHPPSEPPTERGVLIEYEFQMQEGASAKWTAADWPSYFNFTRWRYAPTVKRRAKETP